MERHVRFNFDALTLARRSGKYDGIAPLPRHEIIVASSVIFGWSVDQVNAVSRANMAIVECTPEKFAEFLFWKRDQGFMNSFRELCAKFVLQKETTPTNEQIVVIKEGVVGYRVASMTEVSLYKPSK